MLLNLCDMKYKLRMEMFLKSYKLVQLIEKFSQQTHLLLFC